MRKKTELAFEALSCVDQGSLAAEQVDQCTAICASGDVATLVAHAVDDRDFPYSSEEEAAAIGSALHTRIDRLLELATTAEDIAALKAARSLIRGEWQDAIEHSIRARQWAKVREWRPEHEFGHVDEDPFERAVVLGIELRARSLKALQEFVAEADARDRGAPA